MGGRVSAELFRLRDGADRVIGVASRLSGVGGAIADPGHSASNWLLVIPSRGAIFLTQTDAFDTTVRALPGTDGGVFLSPAQNGPWWREARVVQVTAAAPSTTGSGTQGKVLRGTREFAGLSGSFTETWQLDSVTQDGLPRGRIALSTFTVGAP